MNKKNGIAATVILALLAGIVWVLFTGEDAELAEAKQMRDQMFQKMDTMSPEDRHSGREAIREKMQDFSPEQRREFGQGMRQFAMKRVDKILAMSPGEQRQELDQWIDRMEQMRENRGNEGRGDRGGDMSSAQRDQRSKQRLDRSTPQMRAKMDAMKDLINQRREQRGLEPIQGPRGLLGGGPRR